MSTDLATAPSRLAFVVGAVAAGLSIALLWPLALGADALHQNHATRGIALLGLVIVCRFLIARVQTLVLDAVATNQRRRNRRSLMHSVVGTVPSPDVVGNLLWASERASDGVSLDALHAGVGVAVLNVPILFLYGGWQSAALVIALIGLAIPFYRHAGIVARDADSIFRRQRSDLTTRQLELLTNSVELRALGAVEYGADTVVALSEREHRSALTAIRASLGSSLVTEFLGGVAVGLVAMVVGLGLLHGHERLMPALLSVFASADLIGWIRRYGVAFHQREAVNDAVALLTTPVTPTPAPVRGALVSLGQLRVTEQGQAHSFDVQPGDRLGIVGPSGAGKSTLVDTVLGLRLPHAGRVSRADVPIGRVGIDSPLLGATVRDNLTLGDDILDQHLRAVLAEVGLDLDLDRELSPDGEGLSTGERLRLVIARALLHHVSLLVLDDVAGTLDTEAQSFVRTALDSRPALAVIECSVDASALIVPQRMVHLP